MCYLGARLAPAVAFVRPCVRQVRETREARGMIRERSIRTVLNVLTDWGSRVAVADRPRLAAYIVDALAQPVEVTNGPGHDWWPTPMKDTGTDPPRYLWRCDICHLDQWSADFPHALDPDHPCASSAKVAQPVEVTDEMVERAANAITDRLDGDAHYCAEWGGARCTICRDIASVALRAALEARA